MKRFNKLPKTPQGMKLVEKAKQNNRERIKHKFFEDNGIFGQSLVPMTEKVRYQFNKLNNQLKDL